MPEVPKRRRPVIATSLGHEMFDVISVTLDPCPLPSRFMGVLSTILSVSNNRHSRLIELD